MKVQGIFKTLIIIVACVIIGGFILNTVLPNGLNGIVNTVEGMILKGTGVAFDLNGDGVTNGDASQGVSKDASGNLDDGGAGVEGFTK